MTLFGNHLGKMLKNCLLYITGLLIIGCADLSNTPEPVSDEVRRTLPTQEFKNATITHTKDGSITFVLRSPIIKQNDYKKRADLSGGIEIEFYQNGRPSSYLEADEGEVLKEGRELRARGHVIVHTDSGMVIRTPRMSWSRDDGMIRSDTSVTIITQWDTLMGTGFIASQDLNYRKIFNPVGVSLRSMKEKR